MKNVESLSGMNQLYDELLLGRSAAVVQGVKQHHTDLMVCGTQPHPKPMCASSTSRPKQTPNSLLPQGVSNPVLQLYSVDIIDLVLFLKKNIYWSKHSTKCFNSRNY